MNILGFGLWASSGPFPLSAHCGLYKRGRDPPTNPSRHLKKERSVLPLKWLLKEDQGRRPTAASAAATATAPPFPHHPPSLPPPLLQSKSALGLPNVDILPNLIRTEINPSNNHFPRPIRHSRVLPNYRSRVSARVIFSASWSRGWPALPASRRQSPDLCDPAGHSRAQFKHHIIRSHLQSELGRVGDLNSQSRSPPPQDVPVSYPEPCPRPCQHPCLWSPIRASEGGRACDLVSGSRPHQETPSPRITLTPGQPGPRHTRLGLNPHSPGLSPHLPRSRPPSAWPVPESDHPRVPVPARHQPSPPLLRSSLPSRLSTTHRVLRPAG